MTNLEFVSQISTILKSNNKDNRIPKRTILSIGRDVTTFLVSQKLLDRTITQETSMYSLIECFEFEKIEVKKCSVVEFKMCSTLMKSIKPLPKLVFSRLGASIKNIISLDGSYSFTFVDENQYRRNKKRPNSLKNQVYIYLGSDNHLYIPDKEIFSLDLTVLTLYSTSINECSSCSENNIENCKSAWDYNFLCPDKLIEAVKDMTLQRLMIYKQIQEDQNPNNIENG